MKKYNWIFFKKLHKQVVNIKFQRNNKYKIKYINHKKKIKTMDEYIKKKYFSMNEPYVFTKNDFPYNTDLQHYLLWINPITKNINVDETIKKVLSHIEHKEYIYFQNCQKTKSVKTIPHYHIIIKIS